MRTGRLFFVLMLLALTGCMSNDTIDDVDVNQEKLFGHYCASYNAHSNALNLWAQLRVGGNTGTTVRLTEGHLSVDGYEMSEHYGDESVFNLQGTYYYLKRSLREFSATHSIHWDRTDGERITNQIHLPGPANVMSPAPGDIVSRDGFVVRFDGPSLGGQTQARLILEFTEPSEDRRRRTISKTITAGNEFAFTQSELLGIAAGSRIVAYLTLETRSQPETGHSAEGGLMEAEYRAEHVHFELAR